MCPTLGWLERSGQEIESKEDLSLAEEFRIEQGIEIGKRARNLYPDGILIAGPNLEISAEETAHLIKDGKTEVIFEGTFLTDEYVAKAKEAGI